MRQRVNPESSTSAQPVPFQDVPSQAQVAAKVIPEATFKTPEMVAVVHSLNTEENVNETSNKCTDNLGMDRATLERFIMDRVN